METWYGGGLGRAQGGYDEMVFRAMVRDKATFYDPLGLVSKGTEVDFQSGANAYLYGTRFMSYLALQYTPEKLIDWLRRADGTESYYARDFERVYGKPLTEAWQDWIRWEHEFQEANLKSVREHPITPYKEIARRGLGAISRSYLSKDKTRLYAAVRYAGRVPHLVSIDVATGAVTELAEIEGAVVVSCCVARLRSAGREAVLHDRQPHLPQPQRVRPQDWRDARTVFSGAHRRSRLQPGGPFALGPAHQQRLRDGGAHPVSLQGMADPPRLPVR